jgi:hypothetical protein
VAGCGLDALDGMTAIIDELDFDLSSLNEPTRKSLSPTSSRYSLIEPLLGRCMAKTKADLRALSRVADAHARLVTATKGLSEAIAVFMQKPRPA